jgi:hypothetical protein
MSWTEFEKDIEKGPTGLFKQIFIMGFLFGLVVLGLYLIFKPAMILDQVANPAAIVYKYEYFYNQSEAYRAINKKIVTANKSVAQFKEDAGPRKEWTFEDKTEMSRLRSIADGLAYQCNDIVADYNAKAQQVTRSIFKTASTPYRLTECK